MTETTSQAVDRLAFSTSWKRWEITWLLEELEIAGLANPITRAEEIIRGWRDGLPVSAHGIADVIRQLEGE